MKQIKSLIIEDEPFREEGLQEIDMEFDSPNEDEDELLNEKSQEEQKQDRIKKKNKESLEKTEKILKA